MEPAEPDFPANAQYFDGVHAGARPVSVRLEGLELVLAQPDGPDIRLPFSALHRDDSFLSAPDLRLVFFDYPQVVVETGDAALVHQLTARLGPLDRDLRPATPKTLLLLSAAAIALIAAIFLAMDPLAGFIASRIPPELEQKLGKAALAGLGPDTVGHGEAGRLDSLHAVFLNYLDHTPGQRILLMESDLVNAFALPGGTVVVCTGLIRKLEDPGAYFALLGHEVGHVQNRHVLRSLIKNALLLGVFSVVIGDISGLSAVLTNGAAEITRLSYARGLESEADAFALAQFERNRFSPEGYRALFTLLAGESDGPDVPAMLSTHPGVQRRLEMAGRLTYAPVPYPPEWAEAYRSIRAIAREE